MLTMGEDQPQRSATTRTSRSYDLSNSSQL